MVRELTFSLFRHAQDIIPQVHTRPWVDWVDLFGRHEIRGTEETIDGYKNGPCIVLGRLIGNRSKKNIKSIDALSLDLEHLTEEQLDKILEKISHLEWAVWSTHRSGASCVDGETRLRVVLPLTRSLEPKEFFAAWDGLQALVGGVNDKNTRDIVRLNFLPSTFAGGHPMAYHNAGEWLNPDTLIVAEKKSEYSLEELHAKITRWKRDFDGALLTENREIVKRLLWGHALNEPGKRHQSILMLTLWLAKRFPEWTERDIEVLFASSLAAMQEQENAGPIQQKEIWDAFKGARDKLAAEQPEKKEKEQLPEPQRPNPITEAELIEIAKKQKCKLEELRRRWVVQKAGTVWILRRNGEYSQAYDKNDAPLAIRQLLVNAPVMLWEPTANGGWKKKAIGDIVEDNGSLAKRVIADLTTQYSYFEAKTRTLHEATSPIRKNLEPKYDKQIEMWLQAFGGLEHAKLVDWLSCAPDLSKSLCALYFDGVKESGKTLFAVGVSKLWTEGGPAEAAQVLGAFNDEVLRCPLVFADEKLPKRWGQNSSSAQLRAMLGIQHRSLKRKYQANADLHGALRFVLAANNESLLDELDAGSKADLEAIAQRFLYIRVDGGAEFLKIVPRERLEYWAERGIAEHVLWLAANHQVKEPGKRFFVEGGIAEIHRLLLTGGPWTSLVCEWLIRYLMNPSTIHTDVKYNGLIRIEHGQLLVNEQCITDNWNMYLPNTHQDPVLKQIGQALRAISYPDRKQLRHRTKQIRYRVIMLEHLIAWCERWGIGDVEMIEARINGALPIDAVVNTAMNY